jgi:L-alanine-DL-glutamate epimerase-like enolase superfamily enzyme
MLDEAFKKLKDGFGVIKLKIGGIAFNDELEILSAIRSEYKSDKVVIRLDANGAFREFDVREKLEALSKFDIHSIEQPLPVALNEHTAELCRNPIIPIALDESLIGAFDASAKRELLEKIAPQYIILKPSLHGGLSGADEWISAAEERGIQWWATSALESSLGLDAIAQWVSAKSPKMHQGLGTGALYSNNISPAWEVKNGSIFPLPIRPNWPNEIASIN